MPTAKKKPNKQQSIPAELNGDDTAVLAYQLVSMCRKYLKPNSVPEDFWRFWRDAQFGDPFVGASERGIAGGISRNRRCLYFWVFAQRLRLEVSRREPQEFDLLQESAERDIAEYIGKHFDCYFPTYWMTEGL